MQHDMDVSDDANIKVTVNARRDTTEDANVTMPWPGGYVAGRLRVVLMTRMSVGIEPPLLSLPLIPRILPLCTVRQSSAMVMQRTSHVRLLWQT